MIDFNAKDIDILARTIYGEARGLFCKRDGGLASLISVANVVINRLKANTWFGRTLSDVCLKPFQFSCWNRNDPNRSVIEKVTLDSPLFALCVDVATHVALGKWPDLTKGSDHYYANWLKPAPKWSLGHSPLVHISDHIFFRLHKD